MSTRSGTCRTIGSVGRLKRNGALRRSSGAGRWAGLGILVVVFGVWELTTRLRDVPIFVLPPPSEVVIAAWNERSIIGRELMRTLIEALGGFALASAVAIGLAIAVQRSKTFELSVLPWIMVLQAVPIVAMTPLIALIVGRNTMTAMLIAAIIAFFPIMVNTVRGLRSVSDESLELMHVLAASEAQTFATLRMPTSLPYLFVGLRIAASVVIPGAMIAEWLTGFQGLGYYIIDQSVRFRSVNVWAGILVATAAGVFLFSLVALVERRVISWHAAAESGELP